MQRKRSSIKAVAGLVAKWLLGSVLLAILSGCLSERVISAEELMPPGAKEVMPPRDFVEDVLGKPTYGQFWMRGCTLKGGWPELTAWMATKAKAQDYHLVQYHSAKLDESLKKLNLKNEDYLCIYQSPGATMAIGAINLKLLRDKGGQLEGQADYVLVGGFDLTNFQAQH